MEFWSLFYAEYFKDELSGVSLHAFQFHQWQPRAEEFWLKCLVWCILNQNSAQRKHNRNWPTTNFNFCCWTKLLLHIWNQKNLTGSEADSIANWLITDEQVIFRQKQVNPSEQKGNPDNTINVNTPKPDIEHPQIATHHRETQSLKLRLRWSLDSLQQVRYQERNKSSDGKATR